MASWETLELPQFKGVTGWEFTELKGFELTAYPTAGAGEFADVEPVFDEPEGATVLRQADHGWERLDGLPDNSRVPSPASLRGPAVPECDRF